MRKVVGWTVTAVLLAGLAPHVAARTWTDKTGHFTLEADLVAFNADSVLLRTAEKELLTWPLAQLSDDDVKYLESQEATDAVKSTADQKQTWHLRGGTTLVGRVVDYDRRELVIQRRRGKIYVNDRLFSNLPQPYQLMVPRLVGHFENQALDTPQSFEAWVLRQKGQPRSFTVEGVILELETGDEYPVPFLFFTDADRAVLEPGWERWKAANPDSSAQETESLVLQHSAEAYQRDREAAQQQQVSQLQLQLLATAAGVVDMWQVLMLPPPGVAALPVSVVVPARGSADAMIQAKNQYPNYQVGPARRLNRRR